MLTLTCALSDIDQKPNNYSFFIPRGIDYKNDIIGPTQGQRKTLTRVGIPNLVR